MHSTGTAASVLLQILINIPLLIQILAVLQACNANLKPNSLVGGDRASSLSVIRDLFVM